MDAQAALRGRCLCGDVSYEAVGAPGPMWYCHCEACRKASSVAFATWVAASADGFCWTLGESRVAKFSSSPEFQRAFCSSCGAVLPASDQRRNRMLLPAGGLDGGLALRPAYHAFAAAKAPWFSINDDLSCYSSRPEEGEPAALNREAVAPALGSNPVSAQGSCLCGGIAFELSGEIEQMRTCQCSRCRHNTGSAYFVGLPGLATNLVFHRGEDLIRRFFLPGSRYYQCCFCSVCGTTVPGTLPGFDRTVLSAGTLDGDPGLRVRYHIFCGSKASWCELADDLPHFDTYPPQDFKPS